MDISRLTVPEAGALRDAMTVIDRNGLGVAFVVGDDGAMTGLVTDGDIRRRLLAGVGLDAPVGEVMNPDFVGVAADAAPEEVLARLNRTIRVVPLMDDQGRPVDFATLSRWSRIPMAEPVLEGRELEYVSECLSTNWISSQGRFVREFERSFAEYLGVEHAVSCTSGTTALHLSLLAFGVGPGDEVIVPDLTFAATANAVLHAGATPVLVDVCEHTWNIDPDAVERAVTERTRAIVPVHLYGLPADMTRLRSIADAAGAVLIEDAAEGLGATYRGRPVGSLGDAAAFSFFGNKLLTTGEGGMVVFHDAAAADRARLFRDHGMDPQRRYWHQVVGYNYRMTNVQAAIGLAQLERIDELVAAKRRVAARYRRALSAQPLLQLPADGDGRENVYWVFSVVVDPSTELESSGLVERLAELDIDARPFFYPLHQMPPYLGHGDPAELSTSASLSRRGISLPSTGTLDDERIDYVAEALLRLVDPLTRAV